jgi:hypothetical protein
MSRVCTKCNRPELTDGDFYSTRRICKQCAIKKNNTRAKRLIDEKKCVDCQRPAELGSRCVECKKSHRIRYHTRKVDFAKTAKERRQRLKLAAFNAYGGPKCACCGDVHLEFLTIDHVNGDGAAHRKKLSEDRGWKYLRGSMAGAQMYLWLKNNNYPPGFQVLCMNCNFAIGHFGSCPHAR